MTVLVQREVADRLVSKPGESAWGALPARLGLTYETRFLRRVGASLFWPRPKVESAVVRLERRPGEPHEAQAVAAFDRRVGELFRHRRKGLRAALTACLGDADRAQEALAELGLDPRARPETLSLDALWELSRLPEVS